MADDKNILLDVSFDDGKYRIVQEHGKGLRCLRGGEEWRDLTGDNMVLVLASELEDEREKVKKLRAALKPFAFQPHGECAIRVKGHEFSSVESIEIKQSNGGAAPIAIADFMGASLAYKGTK